MAKNRLDVGDIVAEQMQQIIQSDEHKRIFFKKANKNCCACDSCGNECSCKCSDECKGCASHDKFANEINKVVNYLSKISASQEELGLTKSSLVTMHALAFMIKELRENIQKNAQVGANVGTNRDINDISYDELIKNIPEEDLGDDYPELINLLKQRIDESDTGEFSLRSNIFDEISSDPASDLPPSIVLSPENGDAPTWAPGDETTITDLPPASLRAERLPLVPRMPTYDDNGQRVLNLILNDDKEMDKPTIPAVPNPNKKSAFNKLNQLLLKEAQFDNDFEDELDEEELRKSFGLDDELMAYDSNRGSDLDQELEYGDFLESPEDRDPGFIYGPDETYPNIRMRETPFGWENVEDPRPWKGDPHMVRVVEDFDGRPIGKWKKFEDLTPEERLEQEMGAGLHERLDIDPDELTDEEVYPFEDIDDSDEDFDAETTMFNKIRNKHRGDYSYDPDDIDHDAFEFWNDEYGERR